MNKSEILADIAAKGKRVIQVTEELDQNANDAGIRVWVANVFETYGSAATKKNVVFYTVDEGAPEEEAFYMDSGRLRPSTGNARDQLQGWLESNIPAEFVRFTIENVDEDNAYATGRAIKQIDANTATEARFVVWRDGASAPQFRELT